MPEYGTWQAYAGTDALLLAAVLLLIAGVLASLGARLRRPMGVARTGWVVGIMLAVIWVLAYADVTISAVTYYEALVKQIGPYTPPTSPSAPVTALASLAADSPVNNGLVTGWRVRPWTTVVGEDATSRVRPGV